jgi:hypothetical protein
MGLCNERGRYWRRSSSVPEDDRVWHWWRGVGECPVQGHSAPEAFMIRAIRKSDLPRLKELQDGFEWEFGSDFIEGIVATDEHDNPIMFCGAWGRAEVHVAMDKAWSTPGARLALFHQVHDAMNDELKREGFEQVVTWFDKDATKAAKRFQKRLGILGWIMSEKRSWHRRLV